MFRTIVWATDGSEAADRALPYAQALADVPGAKLVVVHAKEVLAGRAAGFPALADDPELEAKIRGQTAALREEGLDATLQLLTGPAPEAAKMIADAAEEAGADVIVVGTRGHGAVATLLLGSVTQRLLHITRRPVLAIPDRVPAVVEREPEPVVTH